VSAIRAKEFPKPFDLALREVGAFPDKKRPKVLFVSTAVHTALLGLRKRLGDVLAEFALEIDTRPWEGHVTIGRVNVQSEVLQPEKISVEPVTFTVDRFALMSSALTPSGSEYETLEEFPL
jgi:2'-5' RNA ligase